jgi:hypothetical protein
LPRVKLRRLLRAERSTIIDCGFDRTAHAPALLGKRWGKMQKNPGPVGRVPGFSLIRRLTLAAGVSGGWGDRQRSARNRRPVFVADRCRRLPNRVSLNDCAIALYCTFVYLSLRSTPNSPGRVLRFTSHACRAWLRANSCQELSSRPCGRNAHAPRPAHTLEVVMSPTITECLEHARQCKWYAARTGDEGDRKFLLWRAELWTKLAREKEQEAEAKTAA